MKRKKTVANKSLQALRQVAASMAGLVPGIDDQERAKVEEHILRILAGTGTQVLGLNEQGEPEFGKRPGIVDELVSFPELVPSLLEGTGWLNKKSGLAGYGKAQSRLGELAAKYMPNAIGEASARTDQLHKAVREGVDLPEAHGFIPNAEDALGVMAGQLPVPGSLVRKLTGGEGQASKMAKTIAGSPLEWLSPTIDPKIANYLSGAGFGGGIGALSDLLASKEIEAPPEYSHDNRVRISDYFAPSMQSHMAEGGRVDKLVKMLRMISLNPEAKRGATQHLLDDPLENVKYASHEAAQSGKITPVDQTSINTMIEKYLNGDASLSDEALGDRLMDLHRSLFGDTGVLKPLPPPVVTQKSGKALVPTAYGTLKE